MKTKIEVFDEDKFVIQVEYFMNGFIAGLIYMGLMILFNLL